MQYFIYPFLLCCLLNLPIYSTAQLIEDFSDGDFTENPVWFGQDSFFQINPSKQLQTKPFNNHLGERMLFTNQTISAQMEWRVWLRLAFNPSAQNQVRWILSATDTSLKNAYYVQLGGSTGSTDSISLYKEINGQKYCIIPGRAATIGKTNNLVQLKVTRDAGGNWELFSDTGSSNIFIREGSTLDSSIGLGILHGFTFKCTSGNVSNLYADNVYAGLPILDKIAPKLLYFEMLNPQQIVLQFSEKMNQIGSAQIEFSQLQKAQASSVNQETWNIHLEQAIIPDSFFTFHLKQLSDLANNSLDTQLVWAYHVLEKDEIILTELLPDPDPVQGLPNAEFIELHNYTRFPVLLKDFNISDPSTQGNILPIILNPYEFAILCANKDTSLFKAFGKTIGMPVWPSLNNSQDTIRLKYKEEIWQEIGYNLDYYQDKEKELGGYSLTLINPNHLCWGAKNWTSSSNNMGGTPGRINDIWETKKDTSSAQLSQLNIKNAWQIELQFNKEITFQKTWKNHIQEQGIQLENIWANTTNSKNVFLQFKVPMQHQFEYQFELNPLIDCLQNKGKQQIQFTYLEAKEPKQNELIITEIYYDELRKGNFPQEEFIELYNKTEHPINLCNMTLSDAVGSVKFPNYILAAKSYLIVCHKNHAANFSLYGSTLGMNSWPSLNSSDNLHLSDSNGFLLHQVQYTDSWLKSTAKIYSCSIEMIDINNPCAGANNWRGSIHPNGASLGNRNSVSANNPDVHPPQLIRIYVPHINQIQVSFSEHLDSISLLNPLNFSLNPILYPKNIYTDPNKRNTIYVNYDKSLQEETDYVMQIPSIQDCAFNTSAPIQSLNFQIPRAPKQGEIIINEVLFNPEKDAYDFIELYNTSQAHLDVSKLQICKINNQGILEECERFAEEGIQLAPNQYMAISEFPALAQNNAYPIQVSDWISHKIPSMNDDFGTIILVDQMHNILDSVYYSDQMHLSFFHHTEGVSLEKINPYITRFEVNNWISAAETQNFSTPCKKNSQFKLSSGQSGKFSCPKSYFSPDADGHDELLSFEYQTGGGHWVADLSIHTSEGKLVKDICKSTLLANSGELHWAGDTNTGERAPIGNYIALWNCYSDKGETEQHKIVISLLAK